MELGRRVSEYQLAASFRDGLVAWSLTLELDNGEQSVLPIENGQEVPVLLEICRRHASLSYDPASKTLDTGLEEPGKGS